MVIYIIEKKGNKSTKEYPKFGHISPKIINKHLWKTQISGHRTLKFVENFIFLYYKEMFFSKKVTHNRTLKKSNNFLKSSIYANNN